MKEDKEEGLTATFSDPAAFKDIESVSPISCVPASEPLPSSAASPIHELEEYTLDYQWRLRHILIGDTKKLRRDRIAFDPIAWLKYFDFSVTTHPYMVHLRRWHPVNYAYGGFNRVTSMIVACAGGDLDACQYLFENGAKYDIRNADDHKTTPMMWAAFKGHVHIMKWLREVGAGEDIRTRNKYGGTPFLRACGRGHLDAVKWLFEAGASEDLRVKTELGETPLLRACKGGHLRVVKFLFEKGAVEDVRTADTRGRTPMFWACSKGHLHIVQWLYAHGAADDVLNSASTEHFARTSPMVMACIKQRLCVVKWLVQVGAVKNISARLGWNRYGQTLMSAAIRKGAPQYRVALWLWGNGANPRTEMFLACRSGRLRDAIWFYEHGAAEHVHGREVHITTMYFACREGHLEVAKWLHRIGVSIRGVDLRGEQGTELFETPMMAACIGQHLEVAQWLFDSGAAADIRTVSLMRRWYDSRSVEDLLIVTPIVAALLFEEEYKEPNAQYYVKCNRNKRHSLAVAKWLFERGADEDVRSLDLFGRTPMHRIAENNAREYDWQEPADASVALEWLSNVGALEDINAEDADGNTPLRLASSSRTGTAVRVYFNNACWLITHGAACDDSGHVDTATLLRDIPESTSREERIKIRDILLADVNAHAAFTGIVLPATRFPDPTNESDRSLISAQASNSSAVKASRREEKQYSSPFRLLRGHEATILAEVADCLGILRGRCLRNAREAEAILATALRAPQESPPDQSEVAPM